MAERGPLAPHRAALVRVAAALGTRGRDQVAEALAQAARRADARRVEEVLLQSHLFVGFPDALEAMLQWREMRPSEPGTEAEASDGWEERGVATCRTVYGGSYHKLRRNIAALHPDLDRWMLVGGYGRVIGRPGLDLATRELCIAALLAVWNAPRQLHSHLRGALNAGAPPAEVEAALEIAAAYIDPPRMETIRGLWDEIVRPTHPVDRSLNADNR